MRILFLLLSSLTLVTLLILIVPAADQYASDAHWFGYSRKELSYKTPYEARVACYEWRSGTHDLTKRNCEWNKIKNEFLGLKSLGKGEYKMIKRFLY